ncbi:YjbH domain-containing protein [Variovorax terrae]|uniref:YjbH domain-containing protein n=1 Tax=Variovorax terrae TaxID=2923278 RepID=A0A9X1VV01_9BURK|nr:YjbH domain-containing protein [Variovorax terrae]MCJ0764336.1 YjbH domain-containing protein [Variovorax terrae]
MTFHGALAVDTSMSPQGYTGLSITPNAHLLGWGKMALAYDNQMPGAANPAGHNLVVGFGLLPNLELSGRIASNTIHNNCFTQGCGARDLSANLKVGIGLDARNQFRLAAGASDIGGQTGHFRAYYGVLSYDPVDFVSLSAGVAKRSNATAPASPLKGVFGSAVVQPLPWLQAHLEYSDKNTWAGARLYAPAAWLPDGWKAHVGANVRLSSSRVTERTWWSVGLDIPLYKVPSLPGARAAGASASLPAGQLREPTYAAEVPASGAALTPSAGQAPATATAPVAGVADKRDVPVPPPPVLDPQLQSMAESLRAKGLEDIQVGRLPDGGIAVKANNATYNWNSLDALGVALGVVARELAPARAGYRLVLTQRQLPLVAVSGQTDCLRQWIAGESATCTAGQLMTPGTTDMDRLLQGVQWVVNGLAPSNHTLRVGLSPVLRSAVAQEYGVFDYSLGVRTAFQMPLWVGAYGEVRYTSPVSNSRNYEPGGVFADRRLQSGMDRAVLSQALRIPLEKWLGADPVQATRLGLYALTAQVSAGKINPQYKGVDAELRWEPGEGRHRFGLEAGRFVRSTPSAIPYGPSVLEPDTAKLLLGSYRYNVAQTRTYLEATGGQFMYNDRGVQLGMRQWFADTAVSLYYRRTKFDNAAGSRSFVGIEISIPIGPRKDMSPTGPVQITGAPRWSYGIETTVGQSANFVTPGYGVTPGLTSLNANFNSDRASLLYFEDNMRRIRDAGRN